MDYTWVLVNYNSKDEVGKKALELAQAGIGYHIVNRERTGHDDIVLAFKFANVKPIPHHLTPATPSQVQRLEERDIKRKGSISQADNRTPKKDTSLTGEIRSKLVVQWVKRGGASYMDKEAFIKKVCEAKGIDYAKI